MDTNINETHRTEDPAANPDLITKAPGSHPVGTGVGAVVGGAAGIGGAIAAGAAAGSVAGPVGAAAGAVVGGVVGGLIGKGVAEGVNPSVEHEYWQNNFAMRPYVKTGTTYEQYGPAYQYGWEARKKYSGKKFDEVENNLESGWNQARGRSPLHWNEAKRATRDAWDRVDSNRKID